MEEFIQAYIGRFIREDIFYPSNWLKNKEHAITYGNQRVDHVNQDQVHELHNTENKASGSGGSEIIL